MFSGTSHPSLIYLWATFLYDHLYSFICSKFFFFSQVICTYLAPSWRRQWHPTPVLLPGKSYGRRSLEGYSPWGRWGSDTTEWLHFHFSLSCIGEGNGNPLQCSCLENPRDGGAWWATVYGVTQSRTWLKWLSSSIMSKKSNVHTLIKNNLLLKNGNHHPSLQQVIISLLVEDLASVLMAADWSR